MSRVAKKPINLPKGVELSTQGETLNVKGPKGTLSIAKPAGVDVNVDNGVANLSPATPADDAITGTPLGQFRNPAERRLGQVATELDYTTMEEVFGLGLHEYLDGLQVKLNSVGDCIFETFFELKPVK